ncbi:microtubule-associated protein 10 [Myxocyprinus asiaticus]|uniref:microtubule-associated protein 10 n=1 Tax=Myxocyprinus asiaticus TaxID=70543 RepID=UPI0022239349|nr:microtubule-associated protein 10 [Myxocyprinus asiaticus]
MSSTHETLFSLEIVIDYVRLDSSRGKILDPAVAVRFLDFPTLLIYRSEKEDFPSKSGYDELCVSPEALSQLNDGDNPEYSFHKGKSCLFKINLDSLHAHLSNTPLYAMVLDVKDDIPKLIGSSLVSLAKATERIKMDVGKHGIGTPTAYGERLICPLCNLMCNSIGAISLAYKVVSLGANLIPHIPENRVYEVGVTHGKEIARLLKTEKHENYAVNILSQHVSFDGQPVDKVISEAKQSGVAAFTQTEHAKQKFSWSEFAYGHDTEEYTTFCPPPLFYNSNVENQHELSAEKCKMLNVEMEGLNIEDPEEDNNDAESAGMHGASEMSARKLTSTPRTQHREPGPAPLGDVIRQLPLLNALLIELSQLNSQTSQQQPLSVHPNLAWLYTSAPAAKPKSEHQKTVAASSQSPTRRLCQSKVKGYIKSTMSSSAKWGSAAKSPPKRKLRYGLTKTFHLRLKQVKPGVTKQHECMEYQAINQVQMHKQTLSDPKHARKSLRRGVKLDETIETLIGCSEIDPAPFETTSKSQSRPSTNASLTKRVASFKKAAKNEALFTEPDQNVRVHIPGALCRYSDHSDQNVHPSSNITNRGNQILSESGREESRPNSPPHRTSLTSSPEQEYQDDFTSLDATDGNSPDPFSSPEPYRHKRNSVSSEHSSTDSGSHRRKDLPVPVKVENSPLRSLNSTHVVRPRLWTSALSLSSDDSDDGSVPASSGNSECQQRPETSKTPSVQRTFGTSESFDSNPANKDRTLSRVSVDSVLSANNSSDHVDAVEERDKLGSLGLDKNYHHISELVINKLPGYTL